MNDSNKIIFAGAGPGAPDLITLRGKKAIENADIIIYAGSLVNKGILAFASPNCKIYDSAPMDLDDIIRIMKDGIENGLKVLRLHTGDPSIYGAIAEQMNELDKLKIGYEVIPGVSSAFASAAALKTELTMPGISQTVILTRREGRTPVPEGQDIISLARSKATMAIFLSVKEIDGLVKDLLSGGYPEQTAAAIVYRATWKEEKIVRGTLADIGTKAKNSQITRQAMIIIGDVIGKAGEYSKLYDSAFTHGFRNKKDD